MDQEKNFETEDNSMKKINYHLQGEKLLLDRKPGEEIVITGISGTFPNSNNVHEYRDNLFNKVNMVLPNRRFQVDHPEIPSCSGTIPHIDRYDTGFFGAHQIQSDSMDPQMSVLQEKTVEAIFDAGLHPTDLQNTRTGVFVGLSSNETQGDLFFKNHRSQTYVITGSQRSMTAHRLSYFLKLKGPSHALDTACSSSLYALEHAYKSFLMDEIDNAIVAAANLCLLPFTTLQFSRLGVLNKDGICMPFDADGKGYARSETIGVMLLQKAKHSKRLYGRIVHVKTSCDGYKEQGITYPSQEAQIKLFTEFYDVCKIDRYSLSFLEAHGTATIVGDKEECFAIDTVFTKQRAKPLLIGSVKSNVGHSEPASGLASIVKSIIAMETGFIPPNMHFKKPRLEIKGLVEGRLKVVSEKMPFEDNHGLIGINSFGFGGSNSHLLMYWNQKTKRNNSDPSNNLPRLVCVSGRTEKAVICLLHSITHKSFDDEYIKLLHNGFRKNVEGHQYRGYTIVSRSGEVRRSTNCLKHFPTSPKPLYIVFGKLKNWRKIGSEFMQLPMFSRYIQSIQKIITKKVNIENIFLNEAPNEAVGDVLGNVVVQLGLLHIFHELEVVPTISMGNSIGELISAYFSKLFSLEEIIYYAFFIDESMFKVIKTFTSNSNLESSETISDKYQAKTSIPLCTPNNASNNESEVDGLNNLSSTLINNNLEWIKNRITENVTKALVDEGYNSLKVKQVINAILNKEYTNIYDNPQSVIINLDDSKLAVSANCPFISTFSEETNYLTCILNALGRLYEYGYNPQITKLYPSIEWPVARGTEMISPYIKWSHRRLKYTAVYKPQSAKQELHSRTIVIVPEDQLWHYLKGHIIDGLNLFPATAFIYLVWETLSIIKGTPITMTNVCFKNCKFIRAVTIPKKEHLKFTISIQSASENFEVTHEDSIVVTGNISLLDHIDKSDNLNQYNNYAYIDNDNIKLTSKDFYKELRLRGYGYKAAFQAVEESNITGTNGYIKWEDNWVTFMDNMMQMNILQYDTRLLYVPTFISKLTIIAEKHQSIVNSILAKEMQARILPVESDIITGKLSSGGITFWGLTATAISRKKIMNVPVLESYKFLPNSAVMDIHQSLRVNMQIILENATTYAVKAIEVIDNFTNKNIPPLMPIIKSVLEDQPLIHPFLKIFTKIPIGDISIETEDEKLNTASSCLLVIASNILNRPQVLKEACTSLVENGFIISRESYNYDVSKKVGDNLKVFTIHRTENESILLLQKQTETKQFKFIKIDSDTNFAWLPELQNAITIKEKDIVLYAENDSNSGILGLVNCLRREPLTKNIRCVFIMDKGEKFNPHISLYSNQLEKQMVVNIYKYGQWGTYRHLILKNYYVESEHCFLNVTSKGDLSSLRWTEGPLRHHMKQQPEKEFIYVYYASLNFRDIMTATGKINVDVVTRNRLEQECVQGLEFSGRNSRGNRVMGMTTHGALSTLISTDSNVVFKVPENWSLEEAATVPAVYGTVIYALILRGKMERGESILIHSGTGGVGQAAIRLALHYGCKVFTTVGTKEKRDVLKNLFPQLKDHHIGNSHDESFEQLILRGTNSYGVNLVLNSLAEEKLQASIRCLAKGGRFIEIGKFDLARNNEINGLLFQKEASFHGVMLDHLFAETSTAKQKLISTMEEGIKNGVIKPLSRTVFKYDEVEHAFRFMAKGKHMGKVLVQLREPHKESCISQLNTKFVGMPRYSCNAEKVYIIIGGLGGFGLELADWLILRGARKLVLVSRKGVATGYQSYRLRIWKTYGVIVKISTSPITTRTGCKCLIQESLLLGPVDAIFNLAVVLADSVFENQTPETFSISFGPKAYTAEYLDEITRELCPNLSEFVMFSSVSCGRGNRGQTNYGMSNSVMERICENRKNSGYPALAIEWGAVGEVGLVAELLENDTEVEISGTLQQKISSCLQTMDILLRQEEAPIVSSMVVAEKQSLYVADNVVDAVINIIGIKDSKLISLHSSLSELGMDSMTSVEIKEVLERDFQIFLSSKDIRTMTLTQLQDIGNNRLLQDHAEKKSSNLDLEMLVKLNEKYVHSSEAYVELESIVSENVPTVLLFPGIEGFANIYQTVTENLNAYTIGMQFHLDNKLKTVAEIAQFTLPTIKKFFPNNTFMLVAYSYGTLIALEVVNILESCGYKGILICIDGAPSLLKKIIINLGIESKSIFETSLICHMFSNYIPPQIIKEQKENLLKCAAWKDRVDLAIKILKYEENRIPGKKYDIEYQRLIVNSIYNRSKGVLDYTPKYSKLISNIVLIKPTQQSAVDLPEDYGLSQYFEKPIQIHTIEGNHITIIKNTKLQELINIYTQVQI